ncbi:hypothetical protein M758_UG093400 [Ceratodon purpureus]|nr:hypothetical protein M758_UG092600 [Ceratodon purpureus]KAG0594612.1 hypothetical protein M758_UG093000 [Ceratodon purpureus]KAG0594616.1 hypothetical protein M758_UG093400 [Ceratodon purpureus]
MLKTCFHTPGSVPELKSSLFVLCQHVVKTSNNNVKLLQVDHKAMIEVLSRQSCDKKDLHDSHRMSPDCRKHRTQGVYYPVISAPPAKEDRTGCVTRLQKGGKPKMHKP